MTLDLIQVLLDNGAYDEAEELALRYPSVLRTAFGLSPKGLRPQQMYAHLHLAGVHDARGNSDKMGLELRTRYLGMAPRVRGNLERCSQARASWPG
jgi:hypothetical protein